MPKIVRTVSALRELLSTDSIALVPTMGALHAGHLSLVDMAREQAETVVVSIFVNPTQFGKGEDFDSYPKTEADDVAKLAGKADIIFIPSVEEMYPQGYATTVSVGGELTDALCGASRPVHFNGVATIVAKLLLQVMPTVAIFGEKDYQQLLVIRRVVADLNIPVEILGCPIVRENDGLALSSRNRYLNTQERTVAPMLYQSICQIRDDLLNGESPQPIIENASKKLTASGFNIDYLELRDNNTLETVALPNKPARIFIVAYLGNCRLIDNIAITL